MSESTCGFEGCEYDHEQIRWTEHSWADTTTARTVGGKPHTITVFAVVDDRQRQPDEVCLAIGDDDAPEPSVEVYLTEAEVERLRDLLGSATRRIAAFQPRVAL